MFNEVIDWKELEKWEDKNKTKCFLVIVEEDVKFLFNPKQIEGIDVYECIQEVWHDYDLSEEYQHVMDTIHERVLEKIKEKTNGKK